MLRALVCIRAQASRESLLCILRLPDLSFLWLHLPNGHSLHKRSDVDVALSLLPQYFLSQWSLNPTCYILDPSSPCFHHPAIPARSLQTVAPPLSFL